MSGAAEPVRRVALVTGGATGIGAAITERLAGDGYDVFVVQRTEVDAAEGRLRFADHPAAQRVYVAAHDLASGGECAGAVAGCIARFGRLDLLVNNAGVSGSAALSPLASCDDEQIDRIVDTNLKAPLRLAREALPHLAVGAGVIVNIGSTAGSHAQANAAAYVATKAGLAGLTRALALDLAPQGVRVVCVEPGDIATATSRSDELLAEVGQAKGAPLGRSGSPEDVADAVAWVASAQARYVTGSTIPVDGGLTAY